MGGTASGWRTMGSRCCGPNGLGSKRLIRRKDPKGLQLEHGAGDGNRTHDIQLGKLTFYL